MTTTKIQRVKPFTTTDVRRRWMMAYGTGEQSLAGQEIVTTSDQKRLWRGDGTLLSGGVDHDTVATVADLATLYLLPSCTRGVWPGDTAFVAASGCEYRCISGNNSTAVWRAVGAGVSAGTTAAFAGLTGAPADNAALVAALGAYAPLASPALTGAPTAPTQLPGDDSDRLATTAFVQATCAGSSGWTFTPGPLTAGAGEYPYVDLDTPSGIIAQLGIAAGNGTWTNPATAGVIAVVFSDGWSAAVGAYEVNRSTTGYPYLTGTTGWVGVDLGGGRSIRPSAYTLQGGPYDGRSLRNWVFEGANDVGADTAAGFAAATWVTIDTRTADLSMPNEISARARYLCTASTAFRWLRWRCTGVDSSGGSYFPLTEFEIYDSLTVGVLTGCTGWASDGNGHYLPYAV